MDKKGYIFTFWFIYILIHIYDLYDYDSCYKEGAYTLCNSMDGTREHYAKWNKPGGEGQMLYDLIFNWNIINKTNKQAKYNQRHWN